MTDTPDSVESHYTQGGLLERIEAALAEAEHNADTLSPEILAPIDHLHTGGSATTNAQAEAVGFTGGDHVLDLGCGIGGPARCLAETYGCRVTGIDLTAEFIDVASELTRRCGLTDKVAFRRGDVLDLPFGDETFDVVLSQNLSMNIADKGTMYREVARVLKPDGRFTSLDYVEGGVADPHYPTGWADTADISHLLAPKDMRDVIERNGLRIVEWIDRSDMVLAAAAKASYAQTRPGPLGLHVALGDDYPVRQSNIVRNLSENRLRYIMVVAERA